MRTIKMYLFSLQRSVASFLYVWLHKDVQSTYNVGTIIKIDYIEFNVCVKSVGETYQCN